jgi:hypothetical protein
LLVSTGLLDLVCRACTPAGALAAVPGCHCSDPSVPPRCEVQCARVQLGGRLCVAARSVGLLDLVCRACTPAGALAAVPEGLLLGSQCTSEMRGAARPCAAGWPGSRPATLSTSTGLHMQPLHACSCVVTGFCSCHCWGSLAFSKRICSAAHLCKSQLRTVACGRCILAMYSSAGLAGTSHMPSRAVLQSAGAQASSNTLMAAALGLAALLQRCCCGARCCCCPAVSDSA